MKKWSVDKTLGMRKEERDWDNSSYIQCFPYLFCPYMRPIAYDPLFFSHFFYLGSYMLIMFLSTKKIFLSRFLFHRLEVSFHDRIFQHQFFFFNVQISFFTKTLNMSSFTHPHVIPNLFFLYSFHGTRNVLLHKENACNPRPRSLSRARIACYYRDFRRTLYDDQVVSETWQLCCGCVIKRTHVIRDLGVSVELV